MRQHQRQEVFQVFCEKKSMILFCTDVACRGLDFPMVKWVVQLDCPDSPETYIHRVGRTARAGGKGSTLLVITPQELDMLYYLHRAKIPLREVIIRDTRWFKVDESIVAEVAQGLKHEAQKAFVSYIRSVNFSENKNVFSVDKIDLEKFAQSLGLHAVPNIGMLKLGDRTVKNRPWEEVNAVRQSTSKSDLPKAVRRRAATHMQRQLDTAKTFLPSGSAAMDDDDDDDPLHVVGTVNAEDVPMVRSGTSLEGLSQKSKALFKDGHGVDVSVGKLGLSQRVVFDDVDNNDEPSKRRKVN
jgi:ATP-dependent RNA helicase DDX10/DBP4